MDGLVALRRLIEEQVVDTRDQIPIFRLTFPKIGFYFVVKALGRQRQRGWSCMIPGPVRVSNTPSRSGTA